MKITIDTKEDSSEDIRKIISLLSTLVERSSSKSRNIFEDSGNSLNLSEPDDVSLDDSSDESEQGNAFANMFGDNDSNDDKTPILEPSKEKEEDAPSIIEY
ncbi:hypothetical protein GF361_05935 [Candidatus Woesearchaeota archaeon]|nr:hypothetical protein [Candidatus Woesearchaeota archaeon]